MTLLAYRRAALTFILPTLLYAATLENGFVLDDIAAIRDNPIVHRGNLVEIFTSDYWAGFHSDRSGLYRPLTVLSFALNYLHSGTSPALYHLTNILLHAATTLLLYVFCGLVSRSRDLAFLSALLFAAHPVQTECVAGLVGRADILAALFSLVALSLHLQRSRWYYLGAGVAMIAALLSKESAVVLPALFLLTDLIQYRAFSEKCYGKVYLLYASLLLAYLAWRWHVLGGLTIAVIDPLDNPLITLAGPLRLLNAGEILFLYLGQLLLPISLSADYSFDALQLTLQLWSVELALVVAGLGFGALLLFLSWRRAPLTAFGLSWIIVSLAPVANIFLPIGTIMAERLLYLPSMGFAMAMAAIFGALRRRHSRAVLWPPIFILLSAYCYQSHARCGDWHDNYALFSQTVETQPRSARAWRGLAKAALERGEDQLALSSWNKALEILPDYYEVYNDLAAFHIAREEYSTARENLYKCLKIRGDYPIGWFNLGLIYYRLGEVEMAGEALERAVILDPHYAKAYYNLGVIALEKGSLDEAAGYFRKTLLLAPQHRGARHNLDAIGRVQLRNGSGKREPGLEGEDGGN